MKKILFTLLAGLIITNFAIAGNSELFTYDADQIDQELSGLQTLENFVAVNEGITLADMQKEDHELISNLNLTKAGFGGISFFGDEPPLGLPSFWWGCIMGPIGILIVHLIAEDSEETKKALWGFLTLIGVNAAITVLYFVIYFIFLAGTLAMY